MSSATWVLLPLRCFQSLIAACGYQKWRQSVVRFVLRPASAAQQFIAQDADVIFGVGGSTGSGAILSAAANRTFVIGVELDEYFTTFGAGAVAGAEYLATSAVKRVDTGVYNLLATLVGDQSAWAGGENYVLSAANDGIGFAPAHEANVPQAVIDQVNAIYAQLKNGTLDTGVDPVTGTFRN